MFRVEADSNCRHLLVIEESIEFLSIFCPNDEIPYSFRGYQRWYREKEQLVSAELIGRFQASMWAHRKAARDKRHRMPGDEVAQVSNVPLSPQG